MEAFTTWLGGVTSLDPELQRRLLFTGAILLVLFVCRRLVLRFVTRRTDDLKLQYQTKKLSAYVATFLGLLLLGWVWLRGFGALTTYFGLLSAGLAIALREPLVDLAGWAFILWRRPFEVGDRIQIGDDAGDVIDVRIFQFSLVEIGNWVAADQSTGRVIHVPNGKVFSEPVANYTRGFQYIWNEIPIVVTFESDWEKAKRILTEIGETRFSQSDAARAQLEKAARSFMIFYTKLTPIVYTSVADHGVLLTLRYLCHPRQRRGTAEAIWEDVLRAFAEHADIDFAYPTQRFFDHAREGKRAPAGFEGAPPRGDGEG